MDSENFNRIMAGLESVLAHVEGRPDHGCVVHIMRAPGEPAADGDDDAPQAQGPEVD